MVEPTYLHIQGEADDPTRVVELVGAAVRIGRGAQCEVQFDDHALAEVQCILRRRGASWSLQPIGPAGLVTIDGLPVLGGRPLPMGRAFQIAGRSVSLHPAAWDDFPASIDGGGLGHARPIESSPILSTRRDGTDSERPQAEIERLRRWEARLERRERRLEDREREKIWEARWRDVAGSLRPRPQASDPTSGRSAGDPTHLRPLPRPIGPVTEVPRVGPRPATPESRALRVAPSSTIVTRSPAEAGSGGPFVPIGPSRVEESRPIESGGRPGPSVERASPTVGGEAGLSPHRPTESIDLPSAASILAAQGTRVSVAVARGRGLRARPGPVPTEPVGPRVWTLPTWLVAPPVLVVSVATVGLSCLLGIVWSDENWSAGRAAVLARKAEGGPRRPLDPDLKVETRWWLSRPGHQAVVAIAIERSAEVDERSGDVAGLLQAARRAAPLNREVRLALADRAGSSGMGPGPAIGLSRDVLSSVVTGRALKRAGKADSALRSYRRALDLATRAEPSRLDAPAFDDESRPGRFRLPREALIGLVVRDILDSGDWSGLDWTTALPGSPVALLSAARVLRDRGAADSDRLVNLAIEAPTVSAEDLAARGEALLLRGRPAEAAGAYRGAIAAVEEGTTRRCWRLALAAILGPSASAEERSELIGRAKGPDDEVTRRALEVERLIRPN